MKTINNFRRIGNCSLQILLFIGFTIFSLQNTYAEDGYRLWLRYEKISDEKLLASYKSALTEIAAIGNSETLKAAANELKTGISGLTGADIKIKTVATQKGSLIIGKASDLGSLLNVTIKNKLTGLGKEGFLIFSDKNAIIITANEDVGVLYGAFRLLKLLQTHQSVDKIDILDAPKTKIRILNHWDNLDRTVERGYAGFSLWDWHRLPGYIDPRYID